MNRFKELRLKHGYKTQQQLASVLYVNQTAISQWERGVTVPSSPLLRKLSQMYGVSIDYILGYDDLKATEKPATVSGDGQMQEILALSSKLTAEELALVIAQLRGIVADR